MQIQSEYSNTFLCGELKLFMAVPRFGGGGGVSIAFFNWWHTPSCTIYFIIQNIQVFVALKSKFYIFALLFYLVLCHLRHVRHCNLYGAIYCQGTQQRGIRMNIPARYPIIRKCQFQWTLRGKQILTNLDFWLDLNEHNSSVPLNSHVMSERYSIPKSFIIC